MSHVRFRVGQVWRSPCDGKLRVVQRVVPGYFRDGGDACFFGPGIGHYSIETLIDNWELVSEPVEALIETAVANFDRGQEKTMTRDELIRRLRALAEPESGLIDPESAHGDADRLLLEFINNPDVTMAFEAIEKWYA